MMNNKKTAVAFLKTVVARRIAEAYQKYVDKNMQHHNVYCKGDALSLQKAMEQAHRQFPKTTINIKHVLEEGNIVAVHSHVKMKPDDEGVAVVHIFRFKDDKIIEMWDIGQAVPTKSPNKKGMF